MANSSLILSSIDFDTLKANFKTFLQTQSVLKDYNYDGSNINVLLDVMSYNSYLNSFYLNMVASEMFLDSAQKYDSVISHAKELNYVPRSARSSAAEISIVFETSGLSGKLTIPKGTKFTGFNSDSNYIFTTDEAKTFVSGNNTFNVANLQIYEGSYYQDTFVVNYDLENQQFLLTNKNADISSISVNVIENNGASNTSFIRAETLYGLNDASDVFFVQATQNNLYEVIFGDGLFGRKPLNSSTVRINYRVAAGADADNISSFVIDEDIGAVNGGLINTTSITVVANSSSGAEQESIESIRFAAPRYFATQQRAVTTDDYASLVLNNFGGEISDVIVYGGQEVEPKLYGRVIISLKPASGTVAPDYIKNKITSYLQDFIALPNRVVISDPDYLYCSIISQVQYDKNTTTKTLSEIQTDVLDSIISYSTNNLEEFGNDLRYSRLVTTIDNADVSVTSNDTDLRLIKRISPKLNYSTTYDIPTSNPIYYSSAVYMANTSHDKLHSTVFDLHSEHASIISSTFTYNAKDGKTYPLSFIEDDQNGKLNVFTSIGTEIIEVDEIGSVDYASGIIKLDNLNVADYDSYISLYIRTDAKDIFATQNKIIIIDPNDVNVSVIETVR